MTHAAQSPCMGLRYAAHIIDRARPLQPKCFQLWLSRLMRECSRRPTLKRDGSARSSFTRMHRPMSVAMLQCCTVGVNSTLGTAATHVERNAIVAPFTDLHNSWCPKSFDLSIDTGLVGNLRCGKVTDQSSCCQGVDCIRSVPFTATRASAARLFKWGSPDAAGIICDSDVALADHVQLLEAVGVFRVLDVTDMLHQSQTTSQGA